MHAYGIFCEFPFHTLSVQCSVESIGDFELFELPLSFSVALEKLYIVWSCNTGALWCFCNRLNTENYTPASSLRSNHQNIFDFWIMFLIMLTRFYFGNHHLTDLQHFAQYVLEFSNAARNKTPDVVQLPSHCLIW